MPNPLFIIAAAADVGRVIEQGINYQGSGCIIRSHLKANLLLAFQPVPSGDFLLHSVHIRSAESLGLPIAVFRLRVLACWFLRNPVSAMTLRLQSRSETGCSRGCARGSSPGYRSGRD